MVLAFCRRGSVIPICLYILVGRYMKERISGLRNENSKIKRTGLFQRINAAFSLHYLIIYKKVSSTFLPNLSLFWYINEGIEKIMADHIHQEMIRNWILVYLRFFLVIVIKDVFLSLVSFLNKLKNLMDQTHPWLLRNVFSFRKEHSKLKARALSSIKVWNPILLIRRKGLVEAMKHLCVFHSIFSWIRAVQPKKMVLYLVEREDFFEKLSTYIDIVSVRSGCRSTTYEKKSQVSKVVNQTQVSSLSVLPLMPPVHSSSFYHVCCVVSCIGPKALLRKLSFFSLSKNQKKKNTAF